jgi:hypothetical protein
MLGDMDDSTQLLIELDAAADPVRGTIGPSDGTASPFSGYVQLIAAIERFRRDDVAGAVAASDHRGYRGERDRAA